MDILFRCDTVTCYIIGVNWNDMDGVIQTASLYNTFDKKMGIPSYK